MFGERFGSKFIVGPQRAGPRRDQVALCGMFRNWGYIRWKHLGTFAWLRWQHAHPIGGRRRQRFGSLFHGSQLAKLLQRACNGGRSRSNRDR